MKKLIFFLTFFFFFGFLIAEEVQVGEYTIEDVTITLFEDRKPEPEPEPEPEKEVEKVEEVEQKSPLENKAKGPKPFYIQPAIGVGTGASMYRFNLSLDADVLVARTKKVNYYIGLDIDARTSALWGFEPRELVLQLNGVFDFIQEGVPELMSASLWISAGIDLFLIRGMRDGDLTEHHFEYSQAWGFGVDLVFKNYVILKFGIEGIIGIWPDLTIAVGYRF
ncbi:hypothetical protein J5690_05295 [bacterium]|nr:hypothetical protein [bacterium]